MDRAKRIRRKRSKRQSLLWNALDRFTAFLYALFVFGRLGDSMSSEDTYCKRSFLAQSFSNRNKLNIKLTSLGIAGALQRNVIVRMLAAFGRFLAYLKLNVYGIFFTFYGVTSGLVHYITMIINGQNITSSQNMGVIISSFSIVFCSIPLLFSSQTATGAIAKSKMMSKVVLDFFDIPEEKLKNNKLYGGKQYVFFALILSIGFGVLSYLLSPWYMPILLLSLIAVYLIFSNPEAGVILTIAAVPLLQYLEVARAGLLIMIAITSLSYLSKLVQRRRSISLSPELTMAALFCAFIFAASLFTAGGAQVTWDAISFVLIIGGGFFLTFNLITSKKAIGICTKTLTVVLVAYSVVGIWNGFYNGILHRISDPVSEQLSDISENVNVLAIFSVGEVFGIMAVLVFPIIFAYALRQKSAKGVSLMIIAAAVTLIACWMCTSYEIVVALLLEGLIFWLLYSHRSLTVIIIAAIPISIAVMLYEYVIDHFGWPNISMILAEYMPASLHSTSVNNEAVKALFSIWSDGNFLGIGPGAHAIETVLAHYTETVTYSEVHSASLWMQILCSAGFFGLVSFLVFIGFIFKRSFRCFARASQNNGQGMGVALLCGILISLILGTVTNIWHNELMLYVFWVNAGLLLSYIRNHDNDAARRAADLTSTPQSADAEVSFYT